MLWWSKSRLLLLTRLERKTAEQTSDIERFIAIWSETHSYVGQRRGRGLGTQCYYRPWQGAGMVRRYMTSVRQRLAFGRAIAERGLYYP